MMTMTQLVDIQVPADDAWDLLGNRYPEAWKWASGLSFSEGFGVPEIEGAPVSARACTTDLGNIREKVRIFDSKNRVLEYAVVEGFPGFIDTAVNHWEVFEEDANSCQVKMSLTMNTKGLVGVIMGPLMGMNIKRLLKQVTKDLKIYLETGDVSKHKAQELAKGVNRSA